MISVTAGVRSVKEVILVVSATTRATATDIKGASRLLLEKPINQGIIVGATIGGAATDIGGKMIIDAAGLPAIRQDRRRPRVGPLLVQIQIGRNTIGAIESPFPTEDPPSTATCTPTSKNGDRRGPSPWPRAWKNPTKP